MAIQIASKQSYFNTTWVKDYSHYVPPHNARNNRKTKGKKKWKNLSSVAVKPPTLGGGYKATEDKLRQKQLALIGAAIDQTLQFFATCIYPV